VGIPARAKASFALRSNRKNSFKHAERTIQRRHLCFPISADATSGYLSSEYWHLTPIFPYIVFTILTDNLMYVPNYFLFRIRTLCPLYVYLFKPLHNVMEPGDIGKVSGISD
jgi:hypothetical protein